MREFRSRYLSYILQMINRCDFQAAWYPVIQHPRRQKMQRSAPISLNTTVGIEQARRRHEPVPGLLSERKGKSVQVSKDL